MRFILILLMTIIFMGPQAMAQDHSHHVKHNMVLFGEANTFYASHIVYKQPHNFQVILKIHFKSEVTAELTRQFGAHAGDEFIYLLDTMDISQIQQKPVISGSIFRRLTDGTKDIIFEKISLQAVEYSIVYFDELPLSLSFVVPSHGLGAMNNPMSVGCDPACAAGQVCRFSWGQEEPVYYCGPR